MDLTVLISTIVWLLMLYQTTLAQPPPDITSLQFSLLDLDGFYITSPISMFPVIAVSQCVLTCLQTTGCTSVAMLNGICITFDGTVTPDAAAVYDTAYDSRAVSERCSRPLPVKPNVEVRHIYPFPYGYAACTCTHGYVGQRTILWADAHCTWTGVEPLCYKSYEWLNNSYYFKSNGMKWEASKDECESYGGWLADIYSQAENDFLVQTTDQLSGPPPYNDGYWIGGVRDNEGDPFSWYHSNQVLNFSNFHGDEPQVNWNEHCLGIFNHSKFNLEWGNANCGRLQGYICKLPIH